MRRRGCECVNRAQQVPMDEILKVNYLADLAMSGLVYKSETIMTVISEETMYIVDRAVFHGKGHRAGRPRTRR